MTNTSLGPSDERTAFSTNGTEEIGFLGENIVTSDFFTAEWTNYVTDFKHQAEASA